MNKVLFLSLLLMILASPAIATDDNVIDSSQDLTTPVPPAKPEASMESTVSSKQDVAVQEMIDLETAYKREYAFLEAQKRELSERLKRYQSSTKAEQQKVNNRIHVLERDSVTRSAKIDQLNILLAEAERSEAAVFESSDSLGLTYSQAEAALKNHGIEIPVSIADSEENDLAKVGYFFKRAISLIHDLGAIQTKVGEFFLEDGKLTQGEIIHLGNIAAYGISDEGSGSLVPAGGGNFKVWSEPTADTALALSNKQQPDLLKLFLFESRTNAIDESPEKTIIGIINSGGVIGWIIVSLGALAGLLILVRAYLLQSNSTNTTQLSNQVIEQVANGDLDAARKNCEEGSSAIARVLSNTLRHLKDDRDHMDSVVHEAILQESGPLDRFGSAILVIASVSPLLGLLGTVTGMIATFDVITEFGTGDPKLLSGGISIALVTTKLGLIIAIPALLAGSLLSAWARNIKRDMEHAALRVTNVFLSKPESDVARASEPVHSDESLALTNPAT
ncbi:MAG: MotA/TolQ/ExbB proton channel family protein [Betaproteobacteria bacterium]|nr:MotA/TolQ/ExbB proton channel family protein [Betaproteobacteria bacterium]